MEHHHHLQQNRMISHEGGGGAADVEESAKHPLNLKGKKMFLHLERCFNDGSSKKGGRDNFVFFFLILVCNDKRFPFYENISRYFMLS